MINREIIYERNLTGSFMKIPVGMDAGLDERLMLRRKLPGLLPVEKAYIDGRGQYWYNISGRQSLDTYCRVREVGMEFIERLIVSICSEMEILEWNLIHCNCLMLDPELIFITNSSQEFIFTIYPCGSHCVETEFQQMMEYLLTRVDHKDNAAVRTAYDIYEKTLQAGYSIFDIRDGILRTRQETAVPGAAAVAPKQAEEKRREPVSPEKKTMKEKAAVAEEQPEARTTAWRRLLEKLVAWGFLDELPKASPKKVQKKKRDRKGKREPEPEVVYPYEEVAPPPAPMIRPTVCLTSLEGKPRGCLLYQGRDQLEDISLGRGTICVGNGNESDVWIDRDTISRMHARIDCEDGNFYIEDLNSTNGTFVNEVPLAYKERRKLQMNDMVSFADIRYRFT